MQTIPYGWARDVKAQEGDETETLASPAETRRSNFEKRPIRDICRSRDITETLE